MEERKGLYWKLFSSTFCLSAFTFGGGYVIISLMKRKFVDQLHWLKEEEMLDLTAIAQSCPGAVAVNASILVGHRVAGYPGAFIAICGTVLPPLIILSVISLFYAAFRSNAIVNAVLKGMQSGVAAVIADVTMTLGGHVVQQKQATPILVMVGAFIATYFFHINVLWIILVCGALGAGRAYYFSRKQTGDKGGAA